MDFLLERRDGINFKRKEDIRNPYDRDRARIIHSAAFRRLQAKTQILGIGDGDFHRTRLTHSMEVSQICRGIIHSFQKSQSISDSVKKFLPPVELIEAIGLSHDIGHPPFGHGGEAVLNMFMKDDGGFEANGQTIRLLSKLEAHTENYGLNPTRRLLLGLLKYPVSYKKLKPENYPEVPENYDKINFQQYTPPKCYMDCDEDVVDWILSPFEKSDVELFTSYDTKNGVPESIYKSLDTTIMDVADDIAYGTHDLEDGIALNLILREHWENEVKEHLDKTFAKYYDLTDVAENLFSEDSSKSHKRKRALGAIIHSFVKSVTINKRNKFQNELFEYKVQLTDEAEEFLISLKSVTFRKMIELHTVKTFEYRGQRILLSIVSAFEANPYKLLKPAYAQLYSNAKSKSEQKRIICDYVAGMTDDYAIRMYERLFIPRQGNVFDKL